jgi:hypothetical protein
MTANPIIFLIAIEIFTHNINLPNIPTALHEENVPNFIYLLVYIFLDRARILDTYFS